MGVEALYRFLSGRPVPLSYANVVNNAFRAHILASYPGLETFTGRELPVYEFVNQWLRRRAQEFGEYLELTPVPPEHELFSQLDAVPIRQEARMPTVAVFADWTFESRKGVESRIGETMRT